MQLRIWHIPNVPGKPFEQDVATPEEGARLLNLLARYDLFLGDDLIDSNAQGLNVLVDGEWEEWCDDEGNEVTAICDRMWAEQEATT